MEGKLIIFAAPSGSGKSTLINFMMDNGGRDEFRIHFSVSATSRLPRGNEKDGKEYHFYTADEFRQKIDNGDFIEYEEVYTNKFYGTLKSEVEPWLENGYNVAFDIDVNGAKRLKKIYGKRALSIFIQPPSIEELRRRLEKRGTETPEVIEQRIQRAQFEIEQAPNFDEVVVNDNLEVAQVEVLSLVEDFLEEE
ncbi:MAG: guanylate kinase [Bacteroidaceae bacterium]|nr:guanylate kinase [Bacteroidaceae bacterium]